MSVNKCIFLFIINEFIIFDFLFSILDEHIPLMLFELLVLIQQAKVRHPLMFVRMFNLCPCPLKEFYILRKYKFSHLQGGVLVKN